jgi:hypothetical protein
MKKRFTEEQIIGFLRETVASLKGNECIALAADTSIPALYVTRLLDEAIGQRGLPKVIRSDNGPEFAGRIMQAWAAQCGIEHRFIQPGKPILTLTQKSGHFRNPKLRHDFHPMGKRACHEEKQVYRRTDCICHQAARAGHAGRSDLPQDGHQ